MSIELKEGQVWSYVMGYEELIGPDKNPIRGNITIQGIQGNVVFFTIEHRKDVKLGLADDLTSHLVQYDAVEMKAND